MPNDPPTTEPSDADLMRRARRDPAAFDAVYRRYLGPVYRYALARLPRVQDAEDVTSATFIEALGALHQYREQGRFPAWLFTIARRQVTAFHRRARPVDDLAAAHDIAAAATSASAVEAAQLVHEYLADLTEPARDALALRFFADLPVREVARVLGKKESATKMLIHRALRQLRQHGAGVSIAHDGAEGRDA